jgi:hypothetical protein
MMSFINNDPLLGNFQQERSQLIEEYRRKIDYPQGKTPIWDKIDAEVSALTDSQKQLLMEDEDYKAAQSELAVKIQEQILQLVKPRIEATEDGQKVLQKVYDAAIVAKKKVVAETNKEMEIFKQWQAFSVSHPEATYQQFIEAMNKSKKGK